MSRFLPSEAFQTGDQNLQLLPIRFERSGSDQYLVSNMVGEFVRLSTDELNRVVELRVSPGDGLYERAYAAHLIARSDKNAQRQLLAMRLRSRMGFLQRYTPLHAFVVTLRCEHSCSYCQVSRQSADRKRFDMSEETAHRALKIAFQTPAPAIKIEFQGGEPLLNFYLIEKIVTAGQCEAYKLGKRVEFVIATTLSLLSDAILDFCKVHDVHISTSLDGPKDLHNKNRPRPGDNSYELAVKGIRRVQNALGSNRISALMTTTERSLGRVEEIVDEYVSLGLDGIFLRPLSPYGFAIKTKSFSKYNASRWLEFYERGIKYILRVNARGKHFPEFYASLILKRMFTDRPLGYVDLRSPAGIGLGALVYNYDGSVFVSDEGRMLAEMGDREFEIGNVRDATYKSLITAPKLIQLVNDSLTQTAPECCECVFEPHCGADPVYHHATQGDVLGIKPLSEFCARQKGIMRLLLDIMEKSKEDAAILRKWAAH